MLTVKLIKKLQDIVAKLKAYAIAKQEDKLDQAAFEYDLAEERAEKRTEFAERLADALAERAYKCQLKEEAAANLKRAKAAQALEELSKV